MVKEIQVPTIVGELLDTLSTTNKNSSIIINHGNYEYYIKKYPEKKNIYPNPYTYFKLTNNTWKHRLAIKPGFTLFTIFTL